MKTTHNGRGASSKRSDTQRRQRNRRLWLQVAAVLMVIIFLAQECAALLPEG